MFGDVDWPLNASRGLSAIDEFLVYIPKLIKNTFCRKPYYPDADGSRVVDPGIYRTNTDKPVKLVT